MSEHILDEQLFELPPYFSDQWIEQNILIEKISCIGLTTRLALDFSKCQWIELSALINLTGAIIKKIKLIERIDILFQAGDIEQKKDEKNAFLFLIESNFFIALSKALKPTSGKCFLWFRVVLSKDKIDKIQIKLALNFKLGDQPKEAIDRVFPVGKDKNNNTLIGISLNDITEDIKIDSSFFSIFDYSPEKQRDYFLIPIKYFTSTELSKIINGKGLLAFIKYDLFKDVDKKENIELSERKETIRDIQNVFLLELLSNAVDHTGGNANILIALRLGNWELRTKAINGIEYWRESYAYKQRYFYSNSERLGQKFIDLFVVDSGQGFSTLEDKFNLDKPKYLIKGIPSISIHRYALFPYTSRKSYPPNELDSLRFTGLGAIAENIIMHDGIISIKDRGLLSYFDSDCLSNISNSGLIEPNFNLDMGLTSISAIIPISDETWISDYKIRTIIFNKTQHNEDILIFTESKKNPLEFKNITVVKSRNKEMYHYTSKKSWYSFNPT